MTNHYVAFVAEAASRLAELGSWPSYINAVESLTSRVPAEGNKNAPGFDAGIACALNLIPPGKQRLSAILHAAYTEEAVEQVKREAVDMDPDSETCWWLAACSICREGGVDWDAFVNQTMAFTALGLSAEKRVAAAKAEFEKMTHLFQMVDGVPFGCVDGCAQGAYIAGHRLAVQYNPAYGIFFISTYLPSLGLDKFPFSERKDEKGRPMSGPVWGSKQFVKASSLGELARIVEHVEQYFDTLDSLY